VSTEREPGGPGAAPQGERGDAGAEAAIPIAGNVVGNAYDKYGTRNPIARLLMDGFLHAVGELYVAAQPTTVLEVGAGEGHLAAHLVRHVFRPRRYVATDVDVSRMPAELPPPIERQVASAYGLPFADGAFDVVVCCEVLEHLDDPARGLAEVARVARRRVLVSTPWEPMWRALNVARGKYLRDLGNTPGHVQHFSRRALLQLVQTRLRVLEVRRPLPWTVVLGEPRR
jgi:ubiquinone/menaquinone biosynthesis C-methylase UbiE